MDLKQMFSGKKVISQARAERLSNQNSTVNRRHVNQLKAGIGLSLAAVAGMAWMIMGLNRQTQAQNAERSQLLARIDNLEKELGEETENLRAASTQQQSADARALTYIEGIEKKLQTINSYMRKRGLGSMQFKKHPSASANSKAAGEKLYSNYNKYLERFVSTMAMVPMGYPRVSAFTSIFGYRGNPFGFERSEFHPGIDFRGNVGDVVKCTANGTVSFAGKAGGYGNCIRIKHTKGIETVYGHLSRIGVRVGERVSVGDIIGKVGSTGRSTGPHLHYEVRRDGKPVNPKSYLSLNM